ncbi:hypothetical protein [Desulfosporosinus nitroreducens]|nr:hypothetical protein [Desulfosporosinus nitroreducens]
MLDEGQKRHGKSAIKKWSDEYQFATNVRLEPREVEQNKDELP